MMAKYNPFFERAGMIRVDYVRDEISLEKKMRRLLEANNFDFDFAKSKTYCRHFFSQLDEGDKKALLEHLSEFAHQPFIKMRTVTPDLLSRVFSSHGFYLYWVNGSLCS